MIVGITGTIGSGKSTVSQYIKSKGFGVIDADAISRSLLDIGEAGYEQVITMFGQQLLLPNKHIDRQALAALIFARPEAKKQLENILHPLIHGQMHAKTQALRLVQKASQENQSTQQGQPTHPNPFTKPTSSLIFWDVPLLFETNFHQECDVTICVVALQEEIVKRVMLRSQMSEQEVLVRLRSQMPQDQKEAMANFVIANHGSIQDLYQQVDAVLAILLDREISFRNH